MFKVTVDNVDYKVAFHHNVHPDFMEKRKYTVCNIYKVNYPNKDAADQKPTYNLIRTGFSYCSLKDNFSYELGRRISLGRATLNYFTSVERKLIEKAYNDKRALDQQMGLVNSIMKEVIKEEKVKEKIDES